MKCMRTNGIAGIGSLYRRVRNRQVFIFQENIFELMDNHTKIHDIHKRGRLPYIVLLYRI